MQIILALEAEPVAIDITGEATDDAAPFSGAASDLSSRGRTASTVMWAPEAWEDGESGLDQRTPDLSDVIQAIIDEPGWDAGHALALFFEDTTDGGDRIVEAFEGAPGAAARMVVVALDPSGGSSSSSSPSACRKTQSEPRRQRRPDRPGAVGRLRGARQRYG